MGLAELKATKNITKHQRCPLVKKKTLQQSQSHGGIHIDLLELYLKTIQSRKNVHHFQIATN